MRVPRRIIVPTDLSDLSLEALQYANEVARLFNAEIIVLHVIDPRDKAGAPRARFEEAEFEARKSIIHLLMEHTIVPQNLKLEICRGSAVDEIIKAVRQFHADLVVMSTHGRTGLRHVLMGSVAEHVVRHSPVPVLTVKSDGPDEIVELREEDIKLNLHLN
jgi:nucleotide-binding universal stress UspA family protein